MEETGSQSQTGARRATGRALEGLGPPLAPSTPKQEAGPIAWTVCELSPGGPGLLPVRHLQQPFVPRQDSLQAGLLQTSPPWCSAGPSQGRCLPECAPARTAGPWDSAAGQQHQGQPLPGALPPLLPRVVLVRGLWADSRTLDRAFLSKDHRHTELQGGAPGGLRVHTASISGTGGPALSTSGQVRSYRPRLGPQRQQDCSALYTAGRRLCRSDQGAPQGTGRPLSEARGCRPTRVPGCGQPDPHRLHNREPSATVDTMGQHAALNAPCLQELRVWGAARV